MTLKSMGQRFLLVHRGAGNSQTFVGVFPVKSEAEHLAARLRKLAPEDIWGVVPVPDSPYLPDQPKGV